VYYSWEMALNIDLDVSFDNMQDWKGIGQKAGEVNNTEGYIKMRFTVEFSTSVELVVT
jgi:hypothetical protein